MYHIPQIYLEMILVNDAPVPSGARTWSDFFIRIMFKSPKVLRRPVFHVLGEISQGFAWGYAGRSFFQKKLGASETEEQMC